MLEPASIVTGDCVPFGVWACNAGDRAQTRIAKAELTAIATRRQTPSLFTLARILGLFFEPSADSNEACGAIETIDQ
jgi:hypothetical protein